MAESMELIQRTTDAKWEQKLEQLENKHKLERLEDQIKSLTSALESEKKEAESFESYAKQYQLEAERLKAENEALKKGNKWEKIGIAVASAVAPTVLHNITTNTKLSHLKPLGVALGDLLAPIPEGAPLAGPAPSAPAAPPAPEAPAISQRLLDIGATFPWLETCGEDYFLNVCNVIKTYQEQYFDQGKFFKN
jgi:hypothetical protein